MSSEHKQAPTLLLVESEIWIRLDVAHQLRSAGFTVVEAANGEEALGLLRGSLRVDFVLTDMLMPRMDGAALVRQASDAARGPAHLYDGRHRMSTACSTASSRNH